MTASVITVTTQLGSGSAIAELVAFRLGYSYCAQEVISRAAVLASVSPEVIADSERPYSFGERLLQTISRARRNEASIYIAREGARTSQVTDPNYYRFFVDRVVLQLVHQGSCVIVGHGAQAILRGRAPQVCNVLIHGSPEARAARLAFEEDLPAEEALALVRKSDREQAEFLKQAYQVDCFDPSLYQFILNSDDLTDSGAAELIVQLARLQNESSGSSTARRILERSAPGPAT